MQSELLLSKNEEISVSKKISDEDVINFIKNIERETSWKIIPLIKDIFDNKIDSASMDKDRPYHFLYVGNGCDKITITFKTENKEAKLSFDKNILAPKL